LECGSEGAGLAPCGFVTWRVVGRIAMRCPVPTRSRSIVIVLVDLDVVVDLDGDGDVDRDAPSWTVRSSSSACAAVSFRPAPRAFGKVAHDGLRGTSESVGAIAMARQGRRRGRGTRWRVDRRQGVGSSACHAIGHRRSAVGHQARARQSRSSQSTSPSQSRSTSTETAAAAATSSLPPSILHRAPPFGIHQF
jgi:hypothetical protein